MSILVDQGYEQRCTALRTANTIKNARASLRRRLAAEGRSGAATAARVLLRNPEVIRSMDVGEFLLMVKFLGKPKVRELLARRHVNPWCQVDELSEVKRRKLAGDLVAFANGELPIGGRS